MDAESRLARGEKVFYRLASRYDLELLPKVGDALGENMLAAKERVFCDSDMQSDGTLSNSLQKIKGVGEKRRRELHGFLTLVSPRAHHIQ
jgi:hypothetical protein